MPAVVVAVALAAASRKPKEGLLRECASVLCTLTQLQLSTGGLYNRPFYLTSES